MPGRAEILIARRRRDAQRRVQLRRSRRLALLQTAVVLVLTVPLILALSDDTSPRDVLIDAEHLTALPPVNPDATASAIAEPAANGAPDVLDHAQQTAPSAVRRTAAEHGGSPGSRWIALECAEVAELVRRSGMPEWMTTVAWRESRCQHQVTNFDRRTADRSYGLFQINVLGDLWTESRDRCGLQKPEELLDPHVNVSCAAALYRAYGYRPWDSGRYFNR